MEASTRSKLVQRFGEFEIEPRSRELRLKGRRIRIQDNPLTVLLLLFERKGEVVTREELKQRLWPADTFVEADDGLNTAIRKLREVLGDSSENPTYIETIPRRGYRFIGEILEDEEPEAATSSTQAALTTIAENRRTSSQWWRVGATCLALALAFGAVAWFRYHPRLGPIRSIAVLPFANLSGEHGQDYFADAMTEELTSDLGKISALRVISRTSAMHYKNTQKTIPEIAQELNVDGVIESSVVRSGDHVRITAQLIDARADRHLWSESYDRDLKDVLTLQSDVARAIAGQVRAAITPDENERLRPQLVDPRAYEAYMRGRFFVDRWTPEDSAQALRSFEQGAALDNNYALAYVGMAECYVYGVAGVSDEEGLKLGIAAATRALELKADMGEAHAMLGMLRLQRDWDFAGAEAEIKKGIALSPNYASAHHWYSHLLIYLGRFDESLAEAKILLELDPVSPTPIGHLAYHYRAARQWDLAIAQYQKELALNPTQTDEYGEMGEAHIGKRMFTEAIQELNRAVEMSRTSTQYPYYLARLGYARALAGDVTEARKILAQLPSTNLNDLACLYAGLGDRDKSISLLNESFRRRTFPLDAAYAVEFDSLRSDPRFVQLLHRVGLR
jgi:TolB-like protein/DNA-binding winged helix-turn-helix (wHTH) protein/Tfp pilus assembly protein PilF